MSEDSVFIKFGGHNLEFFHHYHVNNCQLTKNISHIILYEFSVYLHAKFHNPSSVLHSTKQVSSFFICYVVITECRKLSLKGLGDCLT
jgi:hypothetical protein